MDCFNRFRRRPNRCSALALILSAVVFVTVVGCDRQEQTTSPSSAAPQTQAATQPRTPLIPQVAMKDWCREHGVPESICTRCNDSLVAGFKQKGDWCKEHNLPKTQCFQCDPKLQAQFAAAYKVKYGEEPPPMEE